MKRRLLLLALISLGAAVPLWRLEHDARLRREFEFQQVKEQAAAEIANLRAQAAAALEDADAGAQRVRDLEARGHQLEREEKNLKSEISDLRSQERARLQEVAALPFPAIASQLRAQLGQDGIGTRDSGLATRDSGFGVGNSGEGKERNSESEIRQSPVAGLPLPPHALPGRTTAARDHSGFLIQDSGPVSAAPNAKFQIEDSRPATPARPTGDAGGHSGFQIPNSELILTERGARAMAAALVERDACREQASAQDALLANCEQQAAATRAIVGELMRSEVKLREAMHAKDEILSRSEAAHRAELKAARGTRLGRFGQALKYVGVGAVVGVVIAR
ncbi:MAG: hypothetical protein ACE145_07685 [Terriglobia bacterium]